MLQEVNDTELEDVSTSFAEDASHCNLLNAPIVFYIIAEFVDGIDDSKVLRDE